MKRFLSLILSLCMVITYMPTSVFATDAVDENTGSGSDPAVQEEVITETPEEGEQQDVVPPAEGEKESADEGANLNSASLEDEVDSANQPSTTASTTVAKIGNAEYSSLTDALAAANNGDTVTIVADITENDTVVVPLKSITIKADNGVKAVMAGGIKLETGHKSAAGLDMTFDNLVIEKNLWVEGYEINDLSQVSNFTVKNCTFQNGSSLRGAGSPYMLDINNTSNGSEPISNLKVINNKFIGYGSSVKISGIWAAVCGTAIIEGNTFSNIGHHGIAVYANGSLSEGVNLKINNNEFDYGLKGEGGVAIQLDGLNQISTASLDLTENAFLTNDAAVKILNNSNNIPVDVNGCYWNGNNPTVATTKTFASGSAEIDNWYNTYADGILSDLAKVVAVAKIGDTEYKSLLKAIQAAIQTSGNVTIEIIEDVNLSGVDWPEVTVDGYTVGTGMVTINGNNHSISGLTAPLFSGTWAGKSGLVINDLTIKDSVIEKDVNDTAGTVGVGAFIGYPSASEIITLNNCHLKDSSVKGGHWTGGLVGISGGYGGADGPVRMNITIKDCSVTGSTIEGAGSAGGVIGHAINDANTALTITGVTVTGNTITSTGSSTNKAGAVMGTVGVATTTLDATVSGNTVTSGGTSIDRIYGRFGSNGSTLAVVGGTYDNKSSSFINPDASGTSHSISGGTFAAAIPAEFLAEGFKLVKNSDGTYTVKVKGPEAKIGTVEYKTLAEAIAAAKSGEEIVIIDAGTYTLPATLSDVKISAASGLDVTVDYSAKSGGLGQFNNVTFKGITFKFGTANYTGFQQSQNITFEDCTLNGKFFSYGDMTFTGCTFNAPGSDVYGGSVDYSMWCYAGNITYTDCTFNAAGKFMNVYNEGLATSYKVVATDCTFNSSKASKAALNVKETCGSIFLKYDVEVNNCTANGSFPVASETDSLIVFNEFVQVDDRNSDGDSAITVTIDGTNAYPGPAVAKIGDVEYSSLKKAIKAAIQTKGDVTVEIVADIDLKNAAWPEMKVDGAAGSGMVTINGNNHSIKGLTAPLFSGTWAGKSGLVINDLTIKDSAIEKDVNDTAGTVGVGAFIGYPQASEVITLNNCHLKDSSVKGGHWTGGLVGISGGYGGSDGPVRMNITIKDCSVTGSTIEGAGSAGGVIGHAINDSNTALTITGVTVTGNTITSTGSSNKAGAVMGTVGVSTTTLDASVSNNTVVGKGQSTPGIFGRFGSTGSTLAIVGGSYDCGVKAPEVASTLAVSGGTFAEEIPAAYIVDGYKLTKNVDGTYSVVEKTPVAKIGDTEYKDLDKALEAAKSGETVVLIDNVEWNKLMTIPAGVTLDGNGKTIVIEEKAVKAAGQHVCFNVNGTVQNVDFDLNYDNTTGHGAVSILMPYSNAVIKDNTLTGTYVMGDSEITRGVETASGSSDITISGNTFKNLRQPGYMNAVTNGVVSNNTIDETRGFCVERDGWTFDNNKFLNTTDGDKAVCDICYFATTTAQNADYYNEVSAKNNSCLVEDQHDPKTSYTAEYVAEVDGTKYLSLATAISKASGKTVKLLTDVTVSAPIKIGVTVTLDLGDYTIKADPNGKWDTNTNFMVFWLSGGRANLTVNADKGGIDCAKAGLYAFHLVGPTGTTKAKLTINGGNYAADTTVVNLQNKAQANITGGYFTVSGDADYMLNCIDANRSTCKINVTGGTFRYFDPSNNTAEGEGTNFTADGYCSYAKNMKFTVKPHTVQKIDAVEPTHDSDGLTEGEICSNCGVVLKAQQPIDKITSVASIGNKKYSTLAAAVAAAKSGDTITLLCDCGGDGIALMAADAKNITIDLDGHTYTVSQNPVGSKGTENQGFHFEKGNAVAIKNGTLTSSDANVKMLIQNYCDLTLTDVTVDGSNLAGTGSYVVSNNSGDVVINGSTSIKAKDGDIALDTCKFGSYDVPNVIINTNGEIDGAIEATGGKLDVKSGTIKTIKTDNGYNEGDISVSGGIFCDKSFEPYIDEETTKSAEVGDKYVVASKTSEDYLNVIALLEAEKAAKEAELELEKKKVEVAEKEAEAAKKAEDEARAQAEAIKKQADTDVAAANTAKAEAEAKEAQATADAKKYADAAVEALEKEAKALDAQKEAEKERDEAVEAKKQADADLAEAKADLAAAQNDLAAANAEIDSLKTVLATTEADRDKYSKELDEAKAELAQTQKDLADAQDALKKAEDEIADYKNNVVPALQAENEKLDAEIKKVNAEAAAIKTQADKDVADAKAAQTEAELAKAKAEAEAAEAKAVEAEALAKAKEATEDAKKYADEAIAAKNLALEALNKQKAAEEAKAEADKAKAEADAAASKAKEDLDSAKIDLEDAKSKIEDLEKQLEAAKADVYSEAVTCGVKLVGHDDLEVTWDAAAAPDADGFYVEYKRTVAENWNIKMVSKGKSSININNLWNNALFEVRVVPYKKVGDAIFRSITKPETAEIYTLKKVAAPKVAKSSGTQVKVTINNLKGETGYQISKSLSSTKTNIVATFNTTKVSNDTKVTKAINATKGKVTYYKVRAYKVVDGKKVFAPWSNVTKFTLK